MNNEISFDTIIDIVNNDGKDKRVRKDNIKLTIDCVYKNRVPYRNWSDSVLDTMMQVGSSGGFRLNGSYKNEFNVNYVVLYSTGEDIYWQDTMDEALGKYIYYGDNQKAGRDLHDTKLGGNLVLREVFDFASSMNYEDRINIPPFFLFEKTKGGVKFSGLLVPGYDGIPQREWLTALWAKRNEGGRFQNYKAIFTVLDTSEGCQNSPNDATIDLRWLDDLCNGKGLESIYAPLAWKNYILKGKFRPLLTDVQPSPRTRDEQIPLERENLKMLYSIHDYFEPNPYEFEKFAITMAKYSDSNITSLINTRSVRDGGRDGIGEYYILKDMPSKVTTSFALEAKCYGLDNSVGVKETSRLISRIKQREFGIVVTTSYVSQQAYEEIIEDGHPIAIISGKDIIAILNKIGITSNKSLINYLKEKFPIEI